MSARWVHVGPCHFHWVEDDVLVACAKIELGEPTDIEGRKLVGSRVIIEGNPPQEAIDDLLTAYSKTMQEMGGKLIHRTAGTEDDPAYN